MLSSLKIFPKRQRFTLVLRTASGMECTLKKIRFERLTHRVLLCMVITLALRLPQRTDAVSSQHAPGITSGGLHSCAIIQSTGSISCWGCGRSVVPLHSENKDRTVKVEHLSTTISRVTLTCISYSSMRQLPAERVQLRPVHTARHFRHIHCRDQR